MELADETNPVNLGLGFPDFPPSDYVLKSLADVAGDPDPSLHQYTRGSVIDPWGMWCGSSAANYAKFCLLIILIHF